MKQSKNFLSTIVEEDLKSGKYKEVVTRFPPEKIVEDKGLVQISDPAKILPIIDEVIANNSDNVEKFKAGNNKLLGFFVEQVLKATGGKANPQVVNELVAQQLI